MAKKYIKEHINLVKTLESLSGKPIPPIEVIEVSGNKISLKKIIIFTQYNPGV